MGDAMMNNYWCHMCCRWISPAMEAEIKCPICENGFVEEIGNGSSSNNTSSDINISNSIDIGPERAFSLWAPILLGLIGGLGQSRPRLTAQTTNEQDPNDDMDTELQSLLRRRRRNSAASLFGMVQDIGSSSGSASENNSNNNNNNSLILVNPFNEDQALILQGSLDVNQTIANSFRNYLVGPGLELLLQHLENDSSRYGTPPAEKEAVKALPTVAVKEKSPCAVCLEELEIGSEAKEMPCKHRFHSGCILPWLELHSSCPVCRFQMPSDSSKVHPNGLANGQVRLEGSDARATTDANVEDSVGQFGDESESRRWISTVPWPFDHLFTLSTSQHETSTSAEPAPTMPASSSHSDET